MRLRRRDVDGVIYAVEIDREARTVQFLARLPEDVDFDATEEFALRRRLHDGMRTALSPIFEKYHDEQVAVREAAGGADTQEPAKP